MATVSVLPALPRLLFSTHTHTNCTCQSTHAHLGQVGAYVSCETGLCQTTIPHICGRRLNDLVLDWGIYDFMNGIIINFKNLDNFLDFKASDIFILLSGTLKQRDSDWYKR